MKRLIWVLMLCLALGFSVSCRTTKNTGEAIKEGTTEAAQETGEAAKETGEAVGHAAKKVGEKVEDGSITAAIKMKFANDELVSASHIDVDTTDGMVTLNGTVASQAEADRAVQLAQTVDGVKNVRSNLIIDNKQ
jgi:hyperosmotically inducible periplasmic protein